MGRNLKFYERVSILTALLVIFSIQTHSQEIDNDRRSKSFFIEAGGSAVSVLSANFDFRFSKGHTDGLGMRFGVGYEDTDSKWILIEGKKTYLYFSVPLELNYILGKKRFSLEMGYSLTYAHLHTISKSENYRSEETGDLIVSYVPIGFRLKPKTKGFMLKFNTGPLINYSAPNIFSDNKIQFWLGLSLGYSFY